METEVLKIDRILQGRFGIDKTRLTITAPSDMKVSAVCKALRDALEANRYGSTKAFVINQDGEVKPEKQA